MRGVFEIFRLAVLFVLTVILVIRATGQVLINEVVTDPQHDWSTFNFTGEKGSGTISDGTDEWVELYVLEDSLDLSNWELNVTTGTSFAGNLLPGGAFQTVQYFGKGNLQQTCRGDIVVLGNPIGSNKMGNDVYLRLFNPLGQLIDDVELGDDFRGDGNGNGVNGGDPAGGNANGYVNESICRIPDSIDTNRDNIDFLATKATLGTLNSKHGEVLINEIVSDPQTDWSTHSFTGKVGNGVISKVDEYIELLILSEHLNLSKYTIKITGTTVFSGDLSSLGAFQEVRYISETGGEFIDTHEGDFLLLGNPSSSNGISNAASIVLLNSYSQVIDSVKMGAGAAPNGGADFRAEESILRINDGQNTKDNTIDFVQGPASPGTANILTQVLPITFNSLEAIQCPNGVCVSWSTASELKGDYFSIQKSSNGEVFTEIGTVEAKGHSNSISNYSFLDRSIEKQGVWYYRIIGYDLDGHVDRSKIFSVVMGDKPNSQQSVYPNPFNRRLHFKEPFTGQVILSDSNGKPVFAAFFSEAKHYIEFGELSKGVYLLTLLSDTSVRNYRVSKMD